jgi:hypothetical protein
VVILSYHKHKYQTNTDILTPNQKICDMPEYHTYEKAGPFLTPPWIPIPTPSFSS